MSMYFSIFLACSFFLILVEAKHEGRIAGGTPALPGQFPYQVSLKVYGQHICGGSIISDYYIMTAAHCVVDKRNNYQRRDNMEIEAGTNRLDDGGVTIWVDDVIVHPNYNSGTKNGNKSADIALLRLASALKFSKFIQPILLSCGNVPENTSVVISGWGRLSPGGDIPQQLQWTVLRSQSKRSCDIEMGRNSENLICLGHARNEGACAGDSGGPAVARHLLVGVASFLRRECASEQPDGYVNVASHIDWIMEQSDVNKLGRIATCNGELILQSIPLVKHFFTSIFQQLSPKEN